MPDQVHLTLIGAVGPKGAPDANQSSLQARRLIERSRAASEGASRVGCAIKVVVELSARIRPET